MKTAAAKREKVDGLLGKAQQCLREGRLLDTFHAAQRRDERCITLPVITQVIEAGWHEKRKDTYRDEFRTWNYALRGKSVDGREIRVIVAFEEEYLVIITAMEVGNGNENCP